MKKIVSVVGARPQFVKAAAVSRQWAQHAEVQEVIIHTGQHFDNNMSELFFREMSIPQPKYNLGVNNLEHDDMTALMMERLEPVLQEEKPDFVVVFGDTNSTLAGAQTAQKLGLKLAHVEAGLRSFNNAMPEEYNRIQTDRLSDMLFCPTQTAVENLRKEGSHSAEQQVVLCGDVMYDAALYYAPSAQKPQVNMASEFLLASVHRAENTNNAAVLTSIFAALEEVSHQCQVVLPLHPRTRLKLEELNYDFAHSKITFIDPVGYFEMLYLLQHCRLVMTDSGGLQKEAYFFGKQCVTLRNETEWVELVQHGVNVLAGTEKDQIISCVRESLSQQHAFPTALYGDGHAAAKITKALLSLM
jgi:UDP-GlcNAc3NAcA epimerase